MLVGFLIGLVIVIVLFATVEIRELKMFGSQGHWMAFERGEDLSTLRSLLTKDQLASQPAAEIFYRLDNPGA